MATPASIEERLRLIDTVFTPAAPIKTRDLFFGRMDQLNRVVDTINEPGQHAALYGERGVGKTSLANIINDRLQGIVIAKVTCNRTESFRDIWQKLFKKISFMAKTQGMGFTAKEVEQAKQLDMFLPQEVDLDSTGILTVLEFLTTPILLIFDEFDSVKDEKTRIRFADTIKALSDNAPHVTVLVVGIAKSVNELVGRHPSNERCIRQIRLPRMSPDELTQIIDNGLNKLAMTIDPFTRLNIVEFSYGFPHYTHLLTKCAAEGALGLRSTDIQPNHLDMAIDTAIADASETIRESYQKAIITTKKQTNFSAVIQACALAKEDEHGTFRATDLEEPLKKLTGRFLKIQSFSYHLAKLCGEDRGSVLQVVGSGSSRRYRFSNPLLRAFIRIKLFQSGVLRGSEKTGVN